MKFSIPLIADPSFELNVEPGQTFFILGANGAGKSALVQSLFALGGGAVSRIAAHRANYFQSETPGLSPQERQENEINARNADAVPDARWRDNYGQQRNYVALFDLVESENSRARKIADKAGMGDLNQVTELASKESNLSILNRLLKLSNINVKISIEEGSRVIASHSNGVSYSVARMSDGERNALLLACDVLNAKTGLTLIIDEPERHLHHSIISPLLTMLFSERPDLGFIVATHDISLPQANPEAKVLLLRECKFATNGASVESWDCDLISGELPEGIKVDILGSRRKLLFVEGSDTSLDKPLYATVFPNISIVPKQSCADVQTCVKAIQQTKAMNWLKAWGIIDGDFISDVGKERLESKGIYSLPFYSIESIYYHPHIQVHLAKSKAKDPSVIPGLLERAATETMNRFSMCLDRMARRSVERKIREEIAFATPGQDSIEKLSSININIDIKARIDGEISILNNYLKNKDVCKLITQFPIRETGALIEIARALGYKSCEDYERSVLIVLLESKDALVDLQNLLGPVYQAISKL